MSRHKAYQTPPGLNEWGRQLLSLPLDAILSTINPDGSPHTVPVGFAFEDDRFVIASGSTTRKVRNLEADPRARVLVIAPAASTGIDDGWVAADGTVELVYGERALELNRIAVRPYLTDEGMAGYEKVFLPLMDVAIVLAPERWRYWTEDRVLETMLEAGYTMEDVDRWYVDRPT